MAKKNTSNSEKVSPFAFINSLNEKKGRQVIEEDEKEYSPFLTNRFYSFFQDTVFFANEVNRYNGLEKRDQFDFYYHLLPKKKRFTKWEKKSKDDELVSLIQEYHGCSHREALIMLPLIRMNNELVLSMKNDLKRGGKSNGK